MGEPYARFDEGGTGERLWTQGVAIEALDSERASNTLVEDTRRVGSAANLSSTLPRPHE